MSKVKPFNKKNAIKFAESIYSDKGGKITFTKLCSGKLVNGKVDGKTLYCVIGDAYVNFVSPFLPKEGATTSATTSAIEALAKNATLKDSVMINDFNIDDRLQNALRACYSANDNVTCYTAGSANASGESVEIYVRRAKAAAEAWMTGVVPLLK